MMVRSGAIAIGVVHHLALIRESHLKLPQAEDRCSAVPQTQFHCPRRVHRLPAQEFLSPQVARASCSCRDSARRALRMRVRAVRKLRHGMRRDRAMLRSASQPVQAVDARARRQERVAAPEMSWFPFHDGGSHPTHSGRTSRSRCRCTSIAPPERCPGPE
jgi:hypothetical protein